MHLAIDATNIRTGGGITHLSQMLSAANPIEAGFDRVTVWACNATASQLPSQPWLNIMNPFWAEGGLLPRVYGQQFKLARDIAKCGCDVLFSPGGTVPFAINIPIVTICQNMLPFEPKEGLRFGRLSWMRFKMWLLRHSQGQSFKKSDGLIFLTNYAQKRVSRWLGKTKGHHALIPHGIEPRFEANPKPQREYSEYTIDRPFKFLYVSIVMPYKHQIEVAKAASELRRNGFPIMLQFIGGDWGKYGKNLRHIVRRLDPQEQYLIWQGNLPFNDLHKNYHDADAFIFASSCENLPNILIEAMSAGLPIACSSYGPMPEVLGNAGVYFDPTNSGDIENAMRNLLIHKEMRQHMASKSKELSRVYSWQRCATETFEFIATVAKRRLRKEGENV